MADLRANFASDDAVEKHLGDLTPSAKQPEPTPPPEGTAPSPTPSQLLPQSQPAAPAAETPNDEAPSHSPSAPSGPSTQPVGRSLERSPGARSLSERGAEPRLPAKPAPATRSVTRGFFSPGVKWGLGVLGTEVMLAFVFGLIIFAALSGGGADTASGGTIPVPGTCSVSRVEYSGQYSQDELTNIFGDPGSAASHPAMDANLTSVDFFGFSAQVHKKVADCLAATAAEIKANNIHYPIREFGCYRFDSDNGSSNIGLRSYHTYGAACDINWGTNPFQECPPCIGPYDMPPAIVSAFSHHGFTWGGNWHSVKDFMHFEWHGVKP